MRARWVLPPCRPPARTPTAASCSTSRSTPIWVRANIIVRPSRAAIDAATENLSCGGISSRWWSIVVTLADAGSVECVTGSFMNRLTSESTSPSRVAEKSSRWVPAGVLASSSVTSGRKPRSAIWSASSRTVTSMSSSEQMPRSIRSPSRPGVATMTSTPRWSASIWRS